MENTLENKAKFFAQYYGQQIVSNDSLKSLNIITYVNDKSMTVDNYLELTPLSIISDEDAIEVGRMSGSFNKPPFSYSTTIKAVNEALNEVINLSTFNMPIRTIDFLRSKGYALPFMGLSVEQQIEYGWIKLKENGK